MDVEPQRSGIPLEISLYDDSHSSRSLYSGGECYREIKLFVFPLISSTKLLSWGTDPMSLEIQELLLLIQLNSLDSYTCCAMYVSCLFFPSLHIFYPVCWNVNVCCCLGQGSLEEEISISIWFCFPWLETKIKKKKKLCVGRFFGRRYHSGRGGRGRWWS